MEDWSLETAQLANRARATIVHQVGHLPCIHSAKQGSIPGSPYSPSSEVIPEHQPKTNKKAN